MGLTFDHDGEFWSENVFCILLQFLTLLISAGYGQGFLPYAVSKMFLIFVFLSTFCVCRCPTDCQWWIVVPDVL